MVGTPLQYNRWSSERETGEGSGKGSSRRDRFASSSKTDIAEKHSMERVNKKGSISDNFKSMWKVLYLYYHTAVWI